MAFIYKEKKTGTWYVDFTPPGGRRIRERVGKRKRAAELRLAEVEHDLAFNRAGIANRHTTVAALFREYDEFIANGLREDTVKRYREVMRHFEVYLGDRFETLRLASVDVRLFDQYITWRRAGNSGFSHRAPKDGDRPKAKTVNTELDILGTIFNKAHGWKMMSDQPVENVVRLKEDDSKPARFFSIEEIEVIRLVADAWDRGEDEGLIKQRVGEFHRQTRGICRRVSHCSNGADRKRHGPRRSARLHNARAVVDFLLATGAREDEVLEAEHSWVDHVTAQVHFRECMVWKPGRERVNWRPKGSSGSVGLKPDLLAELRRLRDNSSSPKIFLDARGKPHAARTFERHVRRLIDLADIEPASLHTFRHTFGSHLAMAGVQPQTLQRLMRHGDIQTSMIYAHLNPQHLGDANALLPY